MNKIELRKMIFGHLASVMTNEVVIDALPTDKDDERCWEVQQELYEEFSRRSETNKRGGMP